MSLLRKFHDKWLIHAGILATFALIPVWLRLPQLPIFAPLYVTRFLIFLPMLWSIFWWIGLGAPGLHDLLRNRWRTLWALTLVGLALWGFASLLWAFQRVDHPDVGQTAALQFGVSALFAVVVACAAPSPRALVAVLALDLIWNAALTVAQSLHQGSIGLILLGEFPFNVNSPGVSYLENGSFRWVRPYGLLPHPNLLGAALMTALFAAAAWIITSKRWQRVAGVLIFGFGFLALLYSFSRGSWAGLVGGLLAVILFLRPHVRRIDARISIAAGIAVVIVVGAAFAVAYRPLLEARDLEDTQSVELRSISDRLVFMDFAFRSIAERPILGVGIGNFPWRTSYYLAETNYDLRGDNVHNVLLSAAAELGIVGCALVVLALICGTIDVVRGLRAASADDNRIARLALFGAFVALFVSGIFDHYPWTQIQFQVAWWGCLAGAMLRPSAPNMLRRVEKAEPVGQPAHL